MKTPLSFFILILLAVGGNNRSYGQVSASSSVFVNIISPITVERIDGAESKPINDFFKSVITANLNAIKKRNLTGEIISQPSRVFIHLAEFIIKGENLYSFTITLPASPISFVNAAGNQCLVFDNFISTSGVGEVLSKGECRLSVRANLDYKPDQYSGIYNSPPIDITVNYN